MNIKQSIRHIVLFLFLACLCISSVQQVHAAEKSVSVTLPLEQIIIIDENDSDSKYAVEYKMIPKEAEIPLPQGAEEDCYKFSVKGNNAVDIGPIVYTNNGIFSYSLEPQIKNEANNAFYSKEVYTITVYVKNSASFGFLAEVIVENSDGNKVDAIIYTHDFQEKKKDPSDTQDDDQDFQKGNNGWLQTGDDIKAVFLTVMLLISSSIVIIWFRKKRNNIN